MTTVTSITELKNMPASDLRKEVRTQRNTVAKMHMGIEMSKEKDTARYQREKKQLARMLTVLSEKEASSYAKASEDKEEKMKPKPVRQAQDKEEVTTTPKKS